MAIVCNAPDVPPQGAGICDPPPSARAGATAPAACRPTSRTGPSRVCSCSPWWRPCLKCAIHRRAL